MATTVTLLLYSGKRNPVWELNNKQLSQLKKLLQEKRQLTQELSVFASGYLGYKGFFIQSFKSDLPEQIYCFDGIIDTLTSQANFVDQNSKLEKFLMETGTNILTDLEKVIINDKISKNLKNGEFSVSKKIWSGLQNSYAPPFDSEKWNDDFRVTWYNNCYNYACDKITGTFAQPGYASGVFNLPITCRDLSRGCLKDKLVSTTTTEENPLGHYALMVTAPGIPDFHFYRLDNNEMWSHKPGGAYAINTDNSGLPISDPKTCDRGDYTDICGYFFINPDVVTIL